MGKRWTPEEDKVLERFYALEGYHGCVSRLQGRTANMCIERAQRLELRTGYLNKAQMHARNLMSLADVVIACNLAPNTVRRAAQKAGKLQNIGTVHPQIMTYVDKTWAQSYIARAQNIHEADSLGWIPARRVCSSISRSDTWLSDVLKNKRHGGEFNDFVRSLRWRQGTRRKRYLHPVDFERLLTVVRQNKEAA